MDRFVPLLLLFVTSSGTFAGPAATMPAHPNVLLIIADDLNARLGCYGYDVKTPNIDRLAGRGRAFTRAYAQCPLCSPSRASFMSGWRPEKTGLWAAEPPLGYLKGAVLMQDHFRANGYFVAGIGKVYHDPYERDFRWDIMENPAPEQWNSNRTTVWQKKGEDPLIWLAKGDGGELGRDEVSARRVAELIRENRSRPFFIAAGFHTPHIPWIAPKRFFDLYPPQSICLPPDDPSGDEAIPPIAIPRASGGGTPESTHRQAIAAYQAAVSFLDAQVGILLDTLDRLSLQDRTIVVFWGDNGHHLGEHGGLWRKVTLFEESARVPLLIAASEVRRKGTPTRHFAELVDIYPTLLDLCHLPSVDGLEGASLVPLLRDPDQPVKTAAFTGVPRSVEGKAAPGRSVRTERYRYNAWPDGSEELYDERRDPGEHHNLAGDAQNAQILRELRQLLKAGYRAALIRGR